MAPAVMLAGAKRYAAYCRQNQTDPQYVKQPATFFGPDEHFLSPWSAVAVASTVAAPPAKCCICGSWASKKILQRWYCVDHDQHSPPLPAGLESLSALFVKPA